MTAYGVVAAFASAGVSAAADSAGTAAFSSQLAVPPSRPRYTIKGISMDGSREESPYRKISVSLTTLPNWRLPMPNSSSD